MNTLKQSLYFIGNITLLATLAIHISVHLSDIEKTHRTTKSTCITKHSLLRLNQWLSQAPDKIRLQTIHLEENKAIVEYLSPENVALAWLLPWEKSDSLLSLQQHNASPSHLVVQATLQLKPSGDMR